MPGTWEAWEAWGHMGMWACGLVTFQDRSKLELRSPDEPRPLPLAPAAPFIATHIFQTRGDPLPRALFELKQNLLKDLLFCSASYSDLSKLR